MSTPKASLLQPQIPDISSDLDPTELTGQDLQEQFKTNFIGRSNELNAILDKKLSDCNDIAKYIGGLIDVERARCQWVEKMLLKFPSELLCEGGLMNAAWDSVHTWTSAILTEANDRTRTLKEFKERFESNIITWDQTRKKLLSEDNNQYKKLNESVHQLQKAKERYFKALKDSESDKKSSRQRIDVPSAETQYRAQIVITNKCLSLYYAQTLPALTDEFRKIFADITSRLCDALAYVLCPAGCSASVANLAHAHAAAQESSAAVDAEGELRDLIAKYPVTTPFRIPQDFSFNDPLFPSAFTSISSSLSSTSSSLSISAPLTMPTPNLPAPSDSRMPTLLRRTTSHISRSISPTRTSSSSENGSIVMPAASTSTLTLGSPIPSVIAVPAVSASPEIGEPGTSSSSGGSSGYSGKAHSRKHHGVALRSFLRKKTNASMGPPSLSISLDSGGSQGANMNSPLPSLSGESVKKQFGVPLETLMERQKATHPDLTVPYVVTFLVEGLLSMGAERTLGIFRLSPKYADEAEARARIDSGIMELPHEISICSSMLKTWMRMLPEALIPEALYERATSADSVQDMTDNVLEKLPPHSYATVAYLAHFIGYLTDPNYVAHTQMTAENFAGVFAPCFLHCPYDDLEKRLAFTTKEKNFVLLLLEAVPTLPKSEFRASLSASAYKVIPGDSAPVLPPPPSPTTASYSTTSGSSIQGNGSVQQKRHPPTPAPGFLLPPQLDIPPPSGPPVVMPQSKRMSLPDVTPPMPHMPPPPIPLGQQLDIPPPKVAPPLQATPKPALLCSPQMQYSESVHQKKQSKKKKRGSRIKQEVSGGGSEDKQRSLSMSVGSTEDVDGSRTPPQPILPPPPPSVVDPTPPQPILPPPSVVDPIPSQPTPPPSLVTEIPQKLEDENDDEKMVTAENGNEGNNNNNNNNSEGNNNNNDEGNSNVNNSEDNNNSNNSGDNNNNDDDDGEDNNDNDESKDINNNVNIDDDDNNCKRDQLDKKVERSPSGPPPPQPKLPAPALPPQ